MVNYYSKEKDSKRMKKKLPESILQFINQQETFPILQADKTYPYSDYVWKAAACILL